MARGAAEFEGLFPGLLDDMVAAGVPMLENRPDCIHFGAAGHVLGTATTLRDEFTAYVPSRPHLEWQLRKRALAIPNVELVQQSVAEPRFDPTHERVTGVLLDAADESSAVSADLVVDAAGRGTRLPVWLEQWGYGRPREDSVEVGIGYASHQVHIPEGLLKEKVVVAGASRAEPVGLGMLFYEDGNWGLTTFGTGKVEPPQNFAEMCELADRILPEHFASAIRAGTPIGDVAFHKYPTSRWRRYDELERFPAGIIPFGDAVVSFNPTFGQGMTMTAIQAGNLRSALDAGTTDVGSSARQGHCEDDMAGLDDDGHRRPGPAQRDWRGEVVVQAGWEPVRPVPRGGRDRIPFSQNGSFAGSACWTAFTWSRRRDWSAGPSGTT